MLTKANTIINEKWETIKNNFNIDNTYQNIIDSIHNFFNSPNWGEICMYSSPFICKVHDDSTSFVLLLYLSSPIPFEFNVFVDLEKVLENLYFEFKIKSFLKLLVLFFILDSQFKINDNCLLVKLKLSSVNLLISTKR